MASPNKTSAIEIVDSLLIREGDMQGVNRARYLSVFKEIWEDMNLQGIKDTKRIIVKVNKDTNSIMLPEEATEFASIYGPMGGRMQPLLINKNLSEDMIDLSARKRCGHEDCNSFLCATVKNYELIEETVIARMPNGSPRSFQKVTRKKINPDGSFIQEIIEPEAIYSGGVHTSTELKTKTEFICKLDLDDKGCVVECDDNRKKIYLNCAFCDFNHESGKPFGQEECYNPNLTYNISDDRRRIILPSNLSLDYVIVRFYFTQKTRDIQVPNVCRRLLRLKLRVELDMFDNKVSAGAKVLLQRLIQTEERYMLDNLTRMTLHELYHLISPKRI